MTHEDRQIIKRFAEGEESLRSVAIKIHRNEILITKSARGTPEMDFMAEIDNPAPDLSLRLLYRKKLTTS